MLNAHAPTAGSVLRDLPEAAGMAAVLERFPGGMLGYEFARGRAVRRGIEQQFCGAITRAAWAAGRAELCRHLSRPYDRYVRVAASAISRINAMMLVLYPDGSRRLA